MQHISLWPVIQLELQQTIIFIINKSADYDLD